MMLCLLFHMNEEPPRKSSVNAATLLTAGLLLKLPWAPSCITLKPIPAVTMPNNIHSRQASQITGVKNTRWMYKPNRAPKRITAFK